MVFAHFLPAQCEQRGPEADYCPGGFSCFGGDLTLAASDVDLGVPGRLERPVRGRLEARFLRVQPLGSELIDGHAAEAWVDAVSGGL